MKQMKIAVAVLALIATLFARTAHTDSAWAQPPQVLVEVIPSSVELPSTGEAQAVVVLRNSSTETLHDVRLSWFTEAGVEVAGEPLPLKTLVSHGEFAWTLRLSQAGEEPISAIVHLRVDYTWQAGDETETAPRVAFGSLEVKSREPEVVEQVAGIEVKTSLESLNEQRPGKVYLVITNKSNMPVYLKEVVASGPEFIECEPVGIREEEKKLEPREARVVAIDVKAKDVVRPGKHLLLFEVALEWNKAGSVQTGKLYETREVEVGILGESEILQAFGIPSFLVLPGFLMIVMVGLLWGIGKPQDKKDKFPLKVKTPEFWLVAITLSGIMAFGYPVVTGRLTGIRRNYLEGYGLSDVMWVWLASVSLAVAAYVAVTGGINLYARILQQYRRWEARWLLPTTGDDPIIVLRKLERQNLGVYLDRVKVKIEEETCDGFLLEPRDEDREAFWVAPPIVVKWSEKGADEKLQEKVGEQRSQSGSALTLALLLEEGLRGGSIEWVRWKRRGPLDGPYKARGPQWQEQKDVIVEEE